jgi:hypothetical protein
LLQLLPLSTAMGKVSIAVILALLVFASLRLQVGCLLLAAAADMST